MRLWIDTDVGTNPDDAFALLCATAHPEVELVGVSTVDGDTEARAEVARGLVDAPVVAGADLGRDLVEAARPDAVLAIGPLTNIAALLRSGLLLPRVAVMGGALAPVRHRGAVRDVEHNFGSDPEAVRTVFGEAAELLICPLDATARMRLSPDELARFVEVARTLAEPTETWIDRQRELGVPQEDAVVCLHDPLALLALVGERVATSARRRIAVDALGRVFERDEGRECDVVVDVDVTAALARIFELIARAERTTQ